MEPHAHTEVLGAQSSHGQWESYNRATQCCGMQSTPRHCLLWCHPGSLPLLPGSQYPASPLARPLMSRPKAQLCCFSSPVTLPGILYPLMAVRAIKMLGTPSQESSSLKTPQAPDLMFSGLNCTCASHLTSS